jgi:hypothetical protein
MENKRFRILSHVHGHLEGKDFEVLETETNEMNHLIGALDTPHPEDETTNLWVNLELDGVFI